MADKMTCLVCDRRVDDPYRVYNEHGKVVVGCVDESHSGHLVTPSESAWWHGRKEAKQLRRERREAQGGSNEQAD